jgi:two-component system chemotaxis sensor kinase CheA
MAKPTFPADARRRLTIQTKLSGVIVALVAVIVVPVSLYRASRPARDRVTQAERRAWLYASMASDQVAPALAAGDAKAANRILRSLSVDANVKGVAVYDAAGKWLTGRGTAKAELPPAARLARVQVPVDIPDGPSGTLVLDLSIDSGAAEQAAGLRAPLIVGGGALALGLLAAWLIGRSFARRVRVVSEQALAVAAGDLSRRPLQDNSSDEIGQMARAFKAMVDRIRALIGQIKESAKQEAVRLEQLVVQRTVELDHRNAEMRLVLDNVDQGLVTLTRAGLVSQGWSRVVEEWLGPPTPRVPFGDWLFQGNPEQLQMFEMSWEALLEGLLPRALLLEQLPRRANVGGRALELTYRPIDAQGRPAGAGDDEPFEHILVVITDITAELARARTEQAQRELANVMQRYQRDRTSAMTFYEEAGACCRAIADGSLRGPELLRALHTLKGNAGIMGIGSFATVCHDLESAFAEERELSSDRRAQLAAAWADLEQRLGFLLRTTDKIEIVESELDAVVGAAASDMPRAELVRMLDACRAEPIATRLDYFADQARRLAESLQKLPLETIVEAGGLRSPRGALDDFWAAFVHVIRNAVDHGLETTAERIASGKQQVRRVTLRSRLDREAFVIEVEDNGRGVDWEAIRARARAARLPHATRADLVRALCTDGLSTRAGASELSGRGVGMSAARAACERLGGQLEVVSEPARGTLVRFRWPDNRVGVLDAGTISRPYRARRAGSSA